MRIKDQILNLTPEEQEKDLLERYSKDPDEIVRFLIGEYVAQGVVNKVLWDEDDILKKRIANLDEQFGEYLARVQKANNH